MCYDFQTFIAQNLFYIECKNPWLETKLKVVWYISMKKINVM